MVATTASVIASEPVGTVKGSIVNEEFGLSALEGRDDDDPLADIPDYEYELSANVVEDLITYSRSCMVHNEEQLMLTALGYTMGYF